MDNKHTDAYWHGYFKMACRAAMNALEAKDADGALSILKASLAAAARAEQQAEENANARE